MQSELLMDVGSIPIGLIDFQSEWAGNLLELMAKDIGTQPTSQNSIPLSQNLDFGCIVFFCNFACFVCFETPNCVSLILPGICLTGVG